MRISYLATSENGIESYKIENANGAYAVTARALQIFAFRAKTAALSMWLQALKIPTDL